VILFAVLLLFQTTRPKKGQPCCLYVMLYSVLRFFLEFLRGDYVQPMLWGLKSAQVTALVSFIVALVLFIWAGLRKQKNASGNSH
jgi:phosphatidylglycerol---prolipoprotein diacylglyceryl transferase